MSCKDKDFEPQSPDGVVDAVKWGEEDIVLDRVIAALVRVLLTAELTLDVASCDSDAERLSEIVSEDDIVEERESSFVNVCDDDTSSERDRVSIRDSVSDVVSDKELVEVRAALTEKVSTSLSVALVVSVTGGNKVRVELAVVVVVPERDSRSDSVSVRSIVAVRVRESVTLIVTESLERVIELKKTDTVVVRDIEASRDCSLVHELAEWVSLSVSSLV